MEEKERFLRVFANLPLGVRKEIILVLNDQPITWEVAFIEVDNDTELSHEILERLSELKLI
ncbi:MAG: hypothetical protein UV57_C0017G0007 [Parcubacteria group bacterium GW2011_GWD2_43_10]|uniref:Uncharacterized protein n=2 Tax=Candidatus Vebleniibacteriota TaxID=1817921 RepID=A0A1G2Q1Z1_9BACT|nr:MAG: hypothetical protein UV57_C0017G0007 [Parcubacteria group bacterium GW2011_GWD2_43_10]OHA54595.1 MAG: hypothetical protein A2226_00300 [Candidatus Veblenbacteria bacterium RIFOXYA2_FULL_43_9]OHA57502.1 MAG: hypothetical protein A2441_03815 [Candidatus Veblenbacteria bacterium RIFOXYC2_FULL_42_11]HAO81125.1 hypothetical protein [Candidatus Veblenbacteria bacterium]HBT92071.1 hypothetical protein [Candidatus Veblenbacteria bacterium]